jgi:hypothetical protein
MIGFFVSPAPNQGWSCHALRSSPVTPAADGANPMTRQLTVDDVSFVRKDYANRILPLIFNINSIPTDLHFSEIRITPFPLHGKSWTTCNGGLAFSVFRKSLH